MRWDRRLKGKHEDIAVVTLKFENNTMATLMASRISQAKERKLYVTQENSYIILNYTNQDIEIHRKASSANFTTPRKKYGILRNLMWKICLYIKTIR